MAELQVRHLAAYLPYGLQMERKYKKGQIGTLKSIDFSGDFKIGVLIEGKLIVSSVNEFWPILKPLYEIRDYHVDNVTTLLKHIRDEYEQGMDDTTELDCHNVGGFTLFGKVESLGGVERSMPYWAYERILQRHFDIFSLIQQGLARADILPF